MGLERQGFVMQRLIAFIIVLLGFLSFWYYENNYDFQNICENYYQTNMREKLQKNPKKAIKYTAKWKNACNAELLKNKQNKPEVDFDKSCRIIDKAAMSTLTYVSIIKRNSNNKNLAHEAITETLNNIKPYSNCVEYNVYSGMLSQSLKKVYE